MRAGYEEWLPCSMLDSMGYERIWERLVEHLDQLGSAREVPGGIAVTIDQSQGHSRTVELVMSPRDWDDFVSTMYGDGDPAGTGIKEKVLATPDGVRYLVYRTYDWEPSETRELLDEALHPRPGEWVVTDDEGNVIDRLANCDETATAVERSSGTETTNR